MILRRCCCQFARKINITNTVTGIGSLRQASTSTSAGPSTEDKLVRLARQTLNKAAADNQSGNVNEIESAKRTKQLEGLKQALKNWEEIFKVCPSLASANSNKREH
jgi:hypothetical protein